MDTQRFDGKTLYIINGDKRHYGTMKSDGHTVTLEWPAEAKETGEVIKWGSITLRPEWLSKLRQNTEGKAINFIGKKTPDYYFPDDALDK